jgi:ribose transport system substrate-binding protein
MRARRFKAVHLLLIVISLAVISSLVLAGSGQGRQEKQIVIGYAGNLSLPILAEAETAAIAQAKALGVKLIIANSNDAQTQEVAVRSLLAKKPDAISIDPWDAYAVGPLVKEANSLGIPIIMWVGTSLAGGKVETYIAEDDVKGSRLLSEYIFKKLGGKGEVAYIQGDKSHFAGQAREKGFRQALAKFPNVKLVAYGVGGWVPDKSRNLALNMLTAHPKIGAILTNYDGMSLGAFSAAKTLKKKIVVSGVDGECPMLNSIWNGDMTATDDAIWENISARSIRSAVAVVKGQKLPARDVTPSFVIDKAAMMQIKAGTYKKAGKTELAYLKAQVKRAIVGCK